MGGRLPTGVEWQFAAQDGDPTNMYPWSSSNFVKFWPMQEAEIQQRSLLGELQQVVLDLGVDRVAPIPRRLQKSPLQDRWHRTLANGARAALPQSGSPG